MLDLPLWADALGVTAGTLVALGTIYRYILPLVLAGYRVSRGAARLVEDFQSSGGFAGLSAQAEALSVDVAAMRKELFPNGGTSLRDSVTRIETQVGDVSRRATDVAQVAAALSERQEVLRIADQQFIRELQHYIESQYRDLLLANEGLRASLNEALSIGDEP